MVSAQNGLTITKGTPLEISDVENAFNATPNDMPSAVIVTLGSSKEPGSRILTDAYANLISVMTKYNVIKIAALSAFGTGSSRANIAFAMRWAISHTRLGNSFADHDCADENMKKSGLDFVFARASRLTVAERAPVKFYGDEGAGMGPFAGMGGVSRSSVAAFLVDAVEKNTWDRTTPVVSN